MKTLQHAKKAAFTLVELIIVIAIITLLAGIVVVTINPNQIFQNGRNAQRSQDIDTIRSAIARYLADGSASSPRNLYQKIGAVGSAVGAITNGGTQGTATDCGLITTAVQASGTCTGGAYSSTTAAACPAGSNGTLSSVTNAYNILATGTAGAGNYEVSLNDVLAKGYLPKIPTDPQGTNYKMCIDTTTPSSPNNNANPGKLVIFAPAATSDGLSSAPYVVL